MNEQERAARNLETIRSMMQRATVYRMISWPTALFAGSLALIWPLLLTNHRMHWALPWIVLAGVVAVFNTILVFKKAKREGENLVTPGLRMGLQAIMAPMLVGAVIGIVATFSRGGYSPVLLSWIWMLCYGGGLMATVNFAPRSIWWLGHTFVLSGLYCFYRWPVGIPLWAPHPEPSFSSDLLMQITFGGYHVIYGLYVIFIENKRS
ncbi:hypothetical protein N9124_02310 [bacterium]|nr:hypothetical protein [bacterium]